MNVSPPNNKSTSSGIGSQPFGQSFVQISQGAGSFHPSMPGLFEQHSGGPGFSNSFTALDFFASGSSSSQPNLISFAGPNSFLLGVPFEANANQFNQSNPNSFNQFNATGFNQPNSSQFNQPNPNQFNQSTPSQFNQLTPNQFNQSIPCRDQVLANITNSLDEHPPLLLL